MLLKTAAVATAFLLACCQSVPIPSSAEEVVRRLGDPDAAAADAAMIELVRGGPPNAPPLKKALATCDDPHFRARAERALAICAVDAPVVKGLKVGLGADRAAVQPGETVQFRTTLCNVTSEPHRLIVGWSHGPQVSSALRDGTAMQRLDPWRGDSGQAEYRRFGHCGTGSQPVYLKLAPWSSETFTTTALFQQAREDRQDPPRWPTGAFSFGSSTAPVKDHDVFLDVDPAANGGTLRLRVNWTARGDDLTERIGGEPLDVWRGTLTSNVVEIALRQPR